MLFHVNYGERQAWDEWYLPVFLFHVAPGEVKRHASKRGPHLQPAKACGCRGGLANLENSAADSAPCPGGMYEERSYLRRIAKRIEDSILAARAVVASKERLAPAPASAARYDPVIISQRFGYKIRAIFYQLGIHAKDAVQGELQLLGRIVRRL